MMLTGRYEYTLDAKSRMNFPPKFREEIGDTFYITRWLDHCIAVFSENQWDKLQGKLAELPQIKARDLIRFINGNANEVTADKQGRILLQSFLKTHAGIEKDIVVIGVGDHAEIWDRQKYEDYQSAADIEEKRLLLEI